MKIQDIFEKNIGRQINGVIKVNQKDESVIKQEVGEYVITNELRKHFIQFFNFYGDAFDNPMDLIGVWVSGFFGSGKSHFLKMLSYLLENRQIGNTSTVELFREKFADDPGTFMQIEKSTRHKTETILFNIDIEGPIEKDKTAVLRVFAKMFYNHLGFYGEDLKLAKLEQYIEKQGKTAEFRRVFAEIDGTDWLETRDSYAFKQDSIIEALQRVLKMSDRAANNWFDGSESVQTSVAQLVSEIQEYVESQPAGFRLLFMIDEVGQYVGADLDLLLNLQSLTEEIGTKCKEKVWVICTGQEAIDEIIRVRINEFSRIQARFKTRLSLSSSSVDEVIQKRILQKKASVIAPLEQLYNDNSSVLKNLFTFSDGALSDIKGYTGAQSFVKNYPIVPYQFILMQKAFAEIRKHGNAGIHLSGGERSMLSGFQEAVQKIQEKDEYALVPFWRFYDTVNSFLDSAIRRVIDRCEKAAAAGDGIESLDVSVLKLLFLIRHVGDDLKANIDNIVILMADDIRVDKISLKEDIRRSLERLLKQNYVGKSGEIYNFLSDEEQNIQRGIRDTDVGGTAPIISRIGEIAFGDIYQTKKFRYDKYDFSYDQMVDRTMVGAQTGGMKLRLLTVAADQEDRNKLSLLANSKGEAIVLLAETDYYDALEKAAKIRKYVKQHNVSQLPKSVQDIIRSQQEDAVAYEQYAKDALKQAIENGKFYVDGEELTISSGDAKSKIDYALKYLVEQVYRELRLIEKNIESDAEIIDILKNNTGVLPGQEKNAEAMSKVEEYLEIQGQRHLTTSMADIQSRYQEIPYGWREIDIAAVVAMLIAAQKVTVKYAGVTIQPGDTRLPDLLRKRTEIGKTIISKRQSISPQKMKNARAFLREFFEIMNVPEDEDGLVADIANRFSGLKNYYDTLIQRYDHNAYPGRKNVQTAQELCAKVLQQQKDNTALIDTLLQLQGDLEDCKDDMQSVEGFFNNQVAMFDSAVKLCRSLANDLVYIEKDAAAKATMDEINSIIDTTKDRFAYQNIPKLNGLTAQLRAAHDKLLDSKRSDLLDLITQCKTRVESTASGRDDVSSIVSDASGFYAQKQQEIAEQGSLAMLDAMINQLSNYTDNTCQRIEQKIQPPPPQPEQTPEVKKNIKTLSRQITFPARRLESVEDVDAYVESMRKLLLETLESCDGIQLN